MAFSGNYPPKGGLNDRVEEALTMPPHLQASALAAVKDWYMAQPSPAPTLDPSAFTLGSRLFSPRRRAEHLRHKDCIFGMGGRYYHE